MILLSPYVLGFFGQEYLSARWLLIWLCVSALPYSVNVFVLTYYRLTSRFSALVRAAAVMAFLSLGLITAGTVMGHLPGLAIGWLVAQTLGAPWMIYSLKKLTLQNRDALI
jgi:O-antigen/teichoic acid export membrane protein